SEALKAFARRGAEVASSDEIVHRLLAGDDEVRREVVERFGPQVLDGSGAIDRAALARVVFADRDALAALEALLHPRVVREYSAWREVLGRRPDPPRVAVVGFGYVTSTGRPWYERLRYPLAYEQIVRGHARHYRLDPALLAAVIYQESKFRASARSHAGAIGLMQLQPATAEGIAIRT